MLKTRSRTDVAKSKAGDVASNASDTLSSVKDMVTALGGAVAEVASDKASAVKDAAAPHVEKLADKASDVKDTAADKASTAKDKATDTAAGDKAAQFAGLTRDQAHSLFAEQWMPRIQDAIAAATAGAAARGTQAYQAMPTEVQDRVQNYVPAAKKIRRKRKGKGLIFLGLLTGAAAAAMIYKGQQDKKQKDAAAAAPVVDSSIKTTGTTTTTTTTDLKPAGRSDVTTDVKPAGAVDDSTRPVGTVAPATDDSTLAVEKRIDDKLAQGRQSASE